MYFIGDVVRSIWKDESEKYQRSYKESMERDINDLYDEAMKRARMGLIEYPGVNMNLLVTKGCPHSISDGKFSGCSMCDYHSKFALSLAAMAALRERDPKMYSKVVRASFDNVRGNLPDANIVELVSGYDTLSTDEFPDEAYEEVFGKGRIFKKNPFLYVFETRASSITRENLERIGRYFDKRDRVQVEIGVEVGNEWIRNHWINKDITNNDIINGVKLVHEAGYKVLADVIIGIPGLTENQSIKYFKETLMWLEELGVDEFTCLPLNRKNRTLQGFLYSNLKTSTRLNGLGGANGEHTGLPWLYTAYEAVYQVLIEKPSMAHKINVLQLNPKKNMIENNIAYNDNQQCQCNMQVLQVLSQFQTSKNPENYIKAREEMVNSECYHFYSEFKNKQLQLGDITNTMTIIAEEVAKELWPESYNSKLNKFADELKSFK